MSVLVDTNIERFLTVLPDSPAAYGEWKRLVVQHRVIGSKVHDAKLVAAMNVMLSAAF